MRQCLYLVDRGIPFDVAFSLDDQILTAWCIIHGEFETESKYNFLSKKFEKIG